MTAILGGNNNQRNHDNAFCQMPFQQFNNTAVPAANNNNNPVFDTSYPAQSLPLAEYQFVPNEIIVSPTSIYKVLQFLGKGTFGQVVKCWRLTYEEGTDANPPRVPGLNRVEMVALKVLKCHPSYERQAQTEAAVLGRLSREGIAGRFNVVRPHEFFRHKGHSCLVFEGLDINLYEYLKVNQFKPLQLEHVRMIAQQVLVALAKLKSLGLIHADLKPENIMLVDSVQMPFRVKVIDFGSACFVSSIASTTYLQSRYYRAPEVILGLTYTEAIDMWSLGCVLAELFLGWPLYPGASEYDQIRYIIQTQGMPSDKLLKKANKTRQFFEQSVPGFQAGGTTGRELRWALKTPGAYERETGVKPKETRKYVMKSLKDLQMVGPVPPLEHNFMEIGAHKADKRCFVNLLESMLQLDGQSRMTPLEALGHPFVTLGHLRDAAHSRLFNRSRVLLDTCIHLTPQDLEELMGGQRLPVPNPTRVVDNLTSTAPCMGGTNLSNATPFIQQGAYPMRQVILDFPQHLQSQVPMSYAYPPHPLPVHSSLPLAPLMLTGAATMVTQESNYSTQNLPMISLNQQNPKLDAHGQRLQALQVFDSLQGGGATTQEIGRVFRPACAPSNHHPRQHLNSHAAVSNPRFRRGRQESKKKERNAGSSKSVAPRGSNNIPNRVPQTHLEHPGASDIPSQPPCGSSWQKQQPWHSRNGSNISKKQENGTSSEASRISNNNNKNINTYNNSKNHKSSNGSGSTGSNNNISEKCETIKTDIRTSPILQRVAIDTADDKTSSSVADSLSSRKERVSQDSGIGRATLPSPTLANVLAAGSSNNISSGSANNDEISPGFHEDGDRRLFDAMRNLKMSEEGSEAFMRDPAYNASDLPVQFHGKNRDGELWMDEEVDGFAFDGSTAQNRRIMNYDSDALDALRLMSEVQKIPQPPSFSILNEGTSRMGTTGRQGHHHLPFVDHARDQLPTNHVSNSLNHPVHPSLECQHSRYQQRQQPNTFLIQQQQSQHINQQPTFLIYQPQQFQSQQSYPIGSLYNVQPNRTVMPQSNHPTSIILLSPEGSPSIYSLVTAPANQAMNCGFYALGNPTQVIGQHNLAQFNPQNVQYIYQA